MAYWNWWSSRVVTHSGSLTVAEDSGVAPMNIVAPSDSRFPPSSLNVRVTGLPTDGNVYLADGHTIVFNGERLSVSQLTGLEFQPTAGQHDVTSAFTYRVTDPRGASATGYETLTIGPGVGPPPPPPPPPGGNDVFDVQTGYHFATIAAAVAAAGNGDTLQVQAGTYTNDIVSTSKSLTLDGGNGMVHVVGTQEIPNGKGLFVISGGNTTIDHFEFSGATVDPSDANGAGIRYEGGNLTLTNDYFHDNQNGLLAAANGSGTITIKNTEFFNNGVADPNSAGYGYTHNLYVGDIASLSLDNVYSHGANIGHEVKSRAESTTIINSRIQDEGGTSSYAIDLPNGGNVLIQNNTIEQGPNSDNPVIIAYGEEGGIHSGSALLIDGNVILNDHNSSSDRAVSVAGATAQITNNQFYGLTQAQIASGSNSQSGNTFLSSEPALIMIHPWA